MSLNSYLKEKLFQRGLTNEEKNIICLGAKAFEVLKDKNDQYYSATHKKRLFLCLLSSDQPVSVQNINGIARDILRLTPLNITTYAAMLGRLDILEQYLEMISPDDLASIFKKQETYEGCFAALQSKELKDFLCFPVTKAKKVSDFLRDAAYRNYSLAARHGHLNVIAHLEQIEGFDRKAAASARGYAAYRHACSNGQLDVIAHFEQIEGFDRKAAASALYYRAYSDACSNGQLDVIAHLDQIGGFNRKAAAHALNYAAYRHTCSNGHLDIIAHLEQIEGFDRKAAASARDYDAYRIACSNGQLDVIVHLEQIDGFDRAAAASACDYAAYRYACSNGQLNIIAHLEQIVGFNRALVASVLNYDAYRHACSNGQLDVIAHLEQIDGFNKAAAANAHGWYTAYRDACSNGQLDVIAHLDQIEGFDRKAAASAVGYEAYRVACFNGHLDIIARLEQIDSFDRKAAASARDYEAYRIACLNGHLDVIAHLEQITDFNKAAAANVLNYDAYCVACSNGQFNIIAHLDQIEGFDRRAAASARDYAAYRHACSNGQLDVIAHLEQIEGFDRKAAASARDYDAYRHADLNGQLDVMQYLLKDKNIFSYAESHDAEYGKGYIYSWVAQRLNTLKQLKDKFEATNPNGIFDISEEEAGYYAIILRNLIRRGVERHGLVAENLTDEMRSLIAIPAIKNLCHQRITESGQENELLRFALSIGNEAAASILFTIPSVNELAQRNNFYQQEQRFGIDITRLAQDRESSMIALTQGEQKRIEKLEKYYHELISNAGVTNVFYNLLEHLRADYESHPATVSLLSGAVLSLPYTWKEFKKLNLSGKDKDNALKAYYQHDIHTVVRYLSKPNKWMSSHSGYVNINLQTGERWSTFDEYIPLISLLYIAAIDETTEMMPTKGFTLEGRWAHFVKELALLGRAHNWDKTRIRNGKEEEYDDLKGDKPSCYSGVKRRLFQSLMGHPLFDILTTEKLKEEFRIFVREHWERTITSENKEAISESYKKILDADDLTPNDIEHLRVLDISKEKQSEFNVFLRQKYGEEALQDSSFNRYFRAVLSYKNDNDAHVLNLGHCKPEQYLDIFSSTSPVATSSATFFAPQSTITNQEELSQHMRPQ